MHSAEAHADLSLPMGKVISWSFFARPADVVAAELIGKLLWRVGVGGGSLVEVEAYLPENDPACHASRGLTPRNAVLFGGPGQIYVYVNYGLHHLVNIVCQQEGVGTGVLLRSLEPVGETAQLSRNRGDSLGRTRVRALAAGPGRLGQALAIDLSWNGRMLGDSSGLYVLDTGWRPAVEATPRIGIGRGSDLPLRFILPHSPYLSRSPRSGQSVIVGAHRPIRDGGCSLTWSTRPEGQAGR